MGGYAVAETRWVGEIQIGNCWLKETVSGNWCFKQTNRKIGVAKCWVVYWPQFFPLIHTSSGCACSLNFFSLSNVPLTFGYIKMSKGTKSQTWFATLYYVNEKKKSNKNLETRFLSIVTERRILNKKTGKVTD